MCYNGTKGIVPPTSAAFLVHPPAFSVLCGTALDASSPKRLTLSNVETHLNTNYIFAQTPVDRSNDLVFYLPNI